MFSIQTVLKFLPSLLAITAGIVLKISNVCHYQCRFYKKFNIPTVIILKMMTSSKCTAHNSFFLFYLKVYTASKILFRVKISDA